MAELLCLGGEGEGGAVDIVLYFLTVNLHTIFFCASASATEPLFFPLPSLGILFIS